MNDDIHEVILTALRNEGFIYDNSHNNAGKWRIGMREDVDCEGELFRAIESIKNSLGFVVTEGYVKIPTSADEAVAMHLLSESWLRANAPEVLKRREPDGVFVGERRRQYLPSGIKGTHVTFERDGHLWLVLDMSSDGEVGLCEVMA